MDKDLSMTLGMLLGRTIALDLLLRNLYTQIAAAQPPADRRPYIFRMIETIIGSMDANNELPRLGPFDAGIWQYAQDELHGFADNVSGRFNEDGSLVMAKPSAGGKVDPPQGDGAA